MDFENNLSFCHNCRICFTVHEEMIPISTLKESDTEFNLLFQYFNIEVMTDVRYPTQICNVCLEQLKNIILFKEKCEATTNYLKDILKDSHTKNETYKIEIPPYEFLSVFKEPKEENEKNEIINVDIKIEKSDEKTEWVTNEDTEIETQINSTKTKDYKCQYCDKTFHTKYGNLRHEATHLKKQFKCDQCSKTFKNNDVLLRHLRIHKGQKPFVCTECCQTFSSSYSLKRHKRIIHGDTNDNDLCEKKANIKNNSEKIEETDVESESNTYEDKQSEIQIKSTIINDYKCQHCDKAFKTKHRLLRHEASLVNKPFKCDECPRSFKNNDLLLRHVRIHLGQKPWVCTECSRSFSSRWGFKFHKRNVHSNTPRQKIVCKECGLAVTNIFAHRKYKHSTYEFQCKYCEKKFPFKSSLANHVNDFHENLEKSFKILCPLCGKVFRTGADLNRHNKSNHSDIRHYSCKYCEKKFKTSSSLAIHRRIHLNIRPFKCTYCKRAFRTKHILEKHIYTHTGERPYKCSICSKDFAQRSTLKTHIKLIHGHKLSAVDLN